MNIEYLKDAVWELMTAAEMGTDRYAYKKLEEKGKEILTALDELRELKEKCTITKKVERYKDKHYCECGCPVEMMLDGITLKPIGGQIYCDQCGAKLDRSEGKE